MLKIRRATKQDRVAILRVFAQAKLYMQQQGNHAQWSGTYPGEEEITADLQKGGLYVVLDEDLGESSSAVVGSFAFLEGEDPTYLDIDDGHWRFKQPYGTIHRLASDGRSRGIAEACFSFCRTKLPYLRIDTHEINKKMQAAILHFGFVYCGKIICSDGTERLAYDYLKD